MKKVDLHIHSTASDGIFSPAEIVRKAASLDMYVIALTDHDTINGIMEALKAARDFPNLKVIPGIEISTETPGGEAHVLGYFVDYINADFKASLDKFRNSRITRAQGMVSKLKKMGINIKWARIQEIAGSGSVGRPHIAQAMLEKGYINSMREAFSRYIANDGPAYVERDKMTPSEAVALILRAGGLPVLAHPFTLNDPESVIGGLKTAGLVGIEAYYKDYSAEDTSELVSLSKAYNLIATGGTDYHGRDNNNETMLGGTKVPIESVEQLIAMAKPQSLKLAGL